MRVVHEVNWRRKIYGHDTFAILGYNLVQCEELMGEDLPCCSNKI